MVVLSTILYQLSEVSLQLIFTDGEEAFQTWTSTDSIYGARQLAHDMSLPNGLLSVNGKSGIEAMEAFVLLDLIGSVNPHPTFHDFFQDTTNLFQRFVKIGNTDQGQDFELGREDACMCVSVKKLAQAFSQLKTRLLDQNLRSFYEKLSLRGRGGDDI